MDGLKIHHLIGVIFYETSKMQKKDRCEFLDCIR